ncbi:hypothetical protein K461DRAFT_231821 [Myriangium duriaei CBS 260.36]|uniref:Nucleolar pre-ribosomal-associated protein 1 N-terminal domain-containing protein n=1 Tax=Myriangium duriaei CBS 260.36 TaxID=1168546 RepID=A0A9P4IUZ5_9PEZI|nr:hypothetical protein K461DRAFT_231821 [Myriangium duriaei CBS 260.36]
MGKRLRENGAGDHSSRKAPKRVSLEESSPPVHIGTTRDLRQQLRFAQDDPEQLRKGQLAFKSFLESIVNPSDSADQDRDTKLLILREYLDSSPTDMLQTWSFAGQVDNDRLVTAVTSNFALLLRTLSSLLEFRDHGLAIAKSLLHREQLKLLSRGLTAESHKEAVISPCLRILTEILSFDGGSCAALVFRQQDFVFNTKFLDRNLRLARSAGEEDRRNSSVRSNTVRYILAHLRFQDVENRIKIVDMRSVFRNLLDNLKNDPTQLINDILKTIEIRILKDQEIPRRYKSAIISDRALAAVIDHIRLSESNTTDSKSEVPWSFLRKVCTDPDLGVVLPCSWYPTPKVKGEDDFGEQTAFARIDPTGIRNPILSKFGQHLRPHTIMEERELLMSIFRRAPELVADYVRQAGPRLSLHPKLTNTWIGYASLIYSIIDLPIPQYFGSTDDYRTDAPPNENVLENILPSPLTSEVLTKCLNQSSSMIRFFALQVMVVSLRKVQNLVRIYDTAAEEHRGYQESILDILAHVKSKFPSIKDIATAYRSLPESELMSREAAAHLLSLHREVLTGSRQDDLFDVATPLASVIASLQSTQMEADDRALVQLQLTHLLDVAEASQGMRWWQRPGNLPYSAFVTIVQLCVTMNGSGDAADKLISVTTTAAFESGILQESTELSAMDALLASLEEDGTGNVLPETWTFIEDCINRLIKKPIKYLDDLDAISHDLSIANPVISLFALVLLEQIPFTERLESAQRENVLSWTSRLLAGLLAIKEDKKVIRKVKDELKSKGFKLPKCSIREILPRQTHQKETNRRTSMLVDETWNNNSRRSNKTLEIAYQAAPQESQKHPELVRYKKQEAEELVHGDTLSSLLLCLCSSFPEIRKQGVTALEEVMVYLKDSNLDSKDQLWLLIGEVLETARTTIDASPLSYIAGCFATAALKVLLEPTHFMFPAVNRYLVKDPYWNVKKLPSYWLNKVLLDTPHEDDKAWPQVELVLGMLVDGVRTPEDVRILRSRPCFERILAIVNSPQVTLGASSLVFQLVYSVITVDGSTGLIMNAGLSTWLDMCRRQGKYHGPALDELSRLTDEKVDKVRIAEWKGFGAEKGDVVAAN